MHPILAERRRLQLHLIAWTLVGALLGLLVRTAFGTTWVGAAVFGLPLGLLASPLSLSSWYVARAMPISRTPPSRLVFTAVGTALSSAALWAGAGYAWWHALADRAAALPDAPTPALAALLLGLGALGYLLSLTVHYLFQAFEESVEASRRALKSQIAQRDAELRALRAQVDPHFLFNSLNSISGLIGPDPQKAREMCQRLADFLRDSLALGASSRIPLGREVALARQYLDVEQVRFGQRLRVEATVSPDSAAVPVPPLILQPLVENAVRHGIATCLEGGTIEIGTRRAGERAVIVVQNPRDVDSSRRGTGFGVDIVRRRLGASFGDRAALAIEPGSGSYRVSVTIPIEEPAS
jgi:two-component system sensor histidine kinase AlgZ